MANLNETSLIHENRSRLLALEKEVVGKRGSDEEYRTLLIRIDERQEQMTKAIEDIKSQLISSTEHKRLVKTVDEHEDRIDALENWKTKVLAYSAVGGSIAGLLFSIAQDLFLGIFD